MKLTEIAAKLRKTCNGVGIAYLARSFEKFLQITRPHLKPQFQPALAHARKRDTMIWVLEHDSPYRDH